MPLTKLYLLAIVLLLLSSCKESSTPVEPIAQSNFNKKLLASKVNNKPALFLSCVRCGCMVDELNAIYKKQPQLLSKFELFADTTCIKELTFKKLIAHSPQFFLDSVYDENYSVMVFSKKADTIDTRLIQTEEVMEMYNILRRY